MDRPFPPDEASAAVTAQNLRAALKRAKFRVPADLTVKVDRSGNADTILVCIKRLGIVRAEVEEIALPFGRVHLDEEDRPRWDMRHLYVRVYYKKDVLEPFRLEILKIMGSELFHLGDRVQIADYWLSLFHSGYRIVHADFRRPRAPIDAKTKGEAAELLADLVASAGRASLIARRDR